MCATPGCGRTRSVRAEEPSFGMAAGAQPVEAPGLEGREVSRYVGFWLHLLRAHAREGLPEAIRGACEELGVARSTATRWLTKGNEEGFPEEVMSPAGGADRRLAAAVHLYRGSWPPPEPGPGGETGEGMSLPPAVLGRSVRYARWLASVVRGTPFPSWLDRLWTSEPRFAPGSRLESTWHRVETGVGRFAEAREPSGDGASLVEGGGQLSAEAWKSGKARRWLSSRLLHRHGYGWMSRSQGSLRRPEYVYGRLAARDFFEHQMTGDGEVPGSFAESVEAWAREHRRRVEPRKLREEDLRLDRTLRYWVKTEPGRLLVAVATRRRVVGAARDEEEAITTETPWLRLRPERRREDPSTGRVTMPVGGQDEPVLLKPSKDAVLEPSP